MIPVVPPMLRGKGSGGAECAHQYQLRDTPGFFTVSAVLFFGMFQASMGTPHLILFFAIGTMVLFAFVAATTRGHRLVRYVALLGVLAVALGIVTEPAHAQFLQGAETFFSSTFTGAGEANKVVFGGLRGLYLIYLFISFIGVFNSVRQDEDWVAAARTPVIVVISVTVVDVLTQLITGGS